MPQIDDGLPRRLQQVQRPLLLHMQVHRLRVHQGQTAAADDSAWLQTPPLSSPGRVQAFCELAALLEAPCVQRDIESRIGRDNRYKALLLNQVQCLPPSLLFTMHWTMQNVSQTLLQWSPEPLCPFTFVCVPVRVRMAPEYGLNMARCDCHDLPAGRVSSTAMSMWRLQHSGDASGGAKHQSARLHQSRCGTA